MTYGRDNKNSTTIAFTAHIAQMMLHQLSMQLIKVSISNIGTPPYRKTYMGFVRRHLNTKPIYCLLIKAENIESI